MILQDWALIVHAAMILAWTGYLANLLFGQPLLNGNSFALGGYLFGYVATGIRFTANLQVQDLGKVMPYCSMASPELEDHRGVKTVTADYYPYGWPITRARLARNGHWFLFLTDLSTFLSTFALVQFSGNVLQESWDGDTFQGYIPDRGIIYIVIACNAVLFFSVVLTFIWLRIHETGLFTDPGSLALLVGMLQNSNVLGDFINMDRGCFSWDVREKLAGHYYRLGYFRKSPGNQIVYTIGRADDDPPVKRGTLTKTPAEVIAN